MALSDRKITTDHYSIKALFLQKQTFVVPKYQRGYAWDDEAVNDFVEDISTCLTARREISNKPKHHFFGGVVTIRREVVGSTRDNYEVIDGQQRLASFVLLAGCMVAEIRVMIAELNGKDNLSENEKKAKGYLEETQTHLTRLYLTFRDNKGIEYSDVPKLTLSNTDHEFFQTILAGETIQPMRASHERIGEAWKRLTTFVKEDILSGPTTKDQAIGIQQFLDDVLGKDCTAIFMCSTDRSEAYQIFQVLNDRGVHLGKGDLLRARTLELLDKNKHQSTQGKVANNWDDILGYAPRTIDDYLLWYFSSMEGRRPKPVNLADEFLEHRFKCKDKDSVNVKGANLILSEVKQLNLDFSTLATINEGNWPWPVNAGVATWDRERLRMLVTHLRHTNAMPLLLSLRTLNQKKFADAVACIERFVFRYKTIVNAHITPMTNVYLKHAKEIRVSRRYSVISLRNDLTELIQKRAPDSIFKTGIQEMKYVSGKRNAQLRYFFITMEDYSQWYESRSQGVPKCLDKTRVLDTNKTTVEHIYPQKPSEDDKDEELEAVKHTLGNLTILSPEDNVDLGNKTAEDKLKAFGTSNLKLNRDIAIFNKWTANNVKKRAELLVEMALKVFVP